MKYKIKNSTDYQTSLFIGAIMLFVGGGELIKNSGYSVVTVINILGAFTLFAQAFVRYKRAKAF